MLLYELAMIFLRRPFTSLRHPPLGFLHRLHFRFPRMGEEPTEPGTVLVRKSFVFLHQNFHILRFPGSTGDPVVTALQRNVWAALSQRPLGASLRSPRRPRSARSAPAPGGFQTVGSWTDSSFGSGRPS